MLGHSFSAGFASCTVQNLLWTEMRKEIKLQRNYKSCPYGSVEEGEELAGEVAGASWGGGMKVSEEALSPSWRSCTEWERSKERHLLTS